MGAGWRPTVTDQGAQQPQPSGRLQDLMWSCHYLAPLWSRGREVPRAQPVPPRLVRHPSVPPPPPPRPASPIFRTHMWVSAPWPQASYPHAQPKPLPGRASKETGRRASASLLPRPGQVLPIKLVTAFPKAITESGIASESEELKAAARRGAGPPGVCGQQKREDRRVPPFEPPHLLPRRKLALRGRRQVGMRGGVPKRCPSEWELGPWSLCFPFPSLVCVSREKFVQI